MSSVSDKEHDVIKVEAFNEPKRVCKKVNFKAGIKCSSPVKVLAFRSHQRHHMRQYGIAFQITPAKALPNLPDQQERRSTTSLGITQ
jgi:hypothetical protein